MKLSDEQQLLAVAYQTTFTGSRESQAVLDDILVFADSLQGPEATGALRVYGHIMKRCTMERRAARKPTPAPVKRVEVRGVGPH